MDTTVPLVYVLMSGKTTESYQNMLHMIMSRMSAPVACETVITDFEQAAITAFRNSLPNARVRGCFFHFQQSLIRKIGTLGLKEQYRE